MTLIEKLLDQRNTEHAAMLESARAQDVAGIAKHSARVFGIEWRLIVALRKQFRFGKG